MKIKIVRFMPAFCIMLAAVQVFACAAITKKGTQCKRAPSPGSIYCWQHGGKNSLSVPAVNESGGEAVNTNCVKRLLDIKSFLGIQFGVPASKIGGYGVKGDKNRRDVQLPRPFRSFKRAIVTFDPSSGLSKTITTEFALPVRKSKEEAMKEFEDVKAIVEQKYSIRISRCVLPPIRTRVSDRLVSMGLASGNPDPNKIRSEFYADDNFCIDIACRTYEVPNKAMKGPNVSSTLRAYKIVLSVTSKVVSNASTERIMQSKDIDAL